MTSKADLRDRARAFRKTLKAADPGAARRAASHAAEMLADLLHPGGRPLVALYRARGSEMDTTPLAETLLTLGCGLCLPSVEKRDAPLLFRDWRPDDPLFPDLVGSEAPLETAPVVDPDLIVTPLLMFDPFGHRLGQGGGYYDRTFEARPGVTRVGLAWLDQEVDRIPAEDHDMPLHGVLTETGYIPARKAD